MTPAEIETISQFFFLAGEVVLLSGQKGPVYCLVPVQGDIALGDKELRRAMAMASLEESWRYAESQGFDTVSDEEIDEEIRIVRQRKPNREVAQ